MREVAVGGFGFVLAGAERDECAERRGPGGGEGAFRSRVGLLLAWCGGLSCSRSCRSRMRGARSARCGRRRAAAGSWGSAGASRAPVPWTRCCGRRSRPKLASAGVAGSVGSAGCGQQDGARKAVDFGLTAAALPQHQDGSRGQFLGGVSGAGSEAWGRELHGRAGLECLVCFRSCGLPGWSLLVSAVCGSA